MSFEALEKKINKIVEKSKAEKEDLEARIEADKTGVEAANKAMSESTLKDDLPGYQEAKRKRQDFKDALEMHSERFETLKDGALIDATEYKKDVESVVNEVRSKEKVAISRIVKAYEDAKEAADDLSRLSAEANRVLYRLQNEVYRCKDVRTLKDGHKHPSDIKKVDCLNTISFGNVGCESQGYRNAKAISRF